MAAEGVVGLVVVRAVAVAAAMPVAAASVEAALAVEPLAVAGSMLCGNLRRVEAASRRSRGNNDRKSCTLMSWHSPMTSRRRPGRHVAHLGLGRAQVVVRPEEQAA